MSEGGRSRAQGCVVVAALNSALRARDIESATSAKRDKAAALKLLKEDYEEVRPTAEAVTDRLRAYSAAMEEIGVADRHELVAVSTIGRRTRIDRFHGRRNEPILAGCPPTARAGLGNGLRPPRLRLSSRVCSWSTNLSPATRPMDVFFSIWVLIKTPSLSIHWNSSST
jgi:hypothetical protein